jgi:hypothetical protein
VNPDAKDLSGQDRTVKNGMSRDLLERVFKYNNKKVDKGDIDSP